MGTHITLAAIADDLGVPRETVRRWFKSQGPKAVNIEGASRTAPLVYLRVDYLAWVKANAARIALHKERGGPR
jgi:hypothetical protein